jgi:hypothetical protein
MNKAGGEKEEGQRRSEIAEGVLLAEAGRQQISLTILLLSYLSQ